MKTIDNWPASIPDSGQINHAWKRVWCEFGAYLLKSVITFTQNQKQRDAVEKVLALLLANNQNKLAWKEAAANAYLVSRNTLSLDLDEESWAATITAWATAQAIVTGDEIWAQRAVNAFLFAIQEGWAAFAFGCSKTLVARTAGENALHEQTQVLAMLLEKTKGADLDSAPIKKAA